MTDLVLYRDGAPVDLNEHPSLLASLHASDRAIRQVDEEIAQLEAEHDELSERLILHEEIGLPTKGVKATITRRAKRIVGLQRRRKAHERNYLEIPPLGWSDGLRIDGARYGESLPVNTPLDVLRALKHAKEQGIFDDFRLYQPHQTGRDPLIVGIVDGAEFYIASWR